MKDIRYIHHHEIDFAKWDSCVDRSTNGLVYAYSWFLNEMSPGWDALVWKDYEAVMPLTKRKKWGISYLYQPAFCAELGIFSESDLNKGLVVSFLQQIPKQFRYIDICLNRRNSFQISDFPFIYRRNFVLPLRHSYEEIEKKYITNHRRNIKKADGAGLQLTSDVAIEEAVLMSRRVMKEVAEVPENDWQSFIRLFNKAQSMQAAVCVGVQDRNGVLLNTAVFFKSHKFWYYLLAGSTEEGKTAGAAHFLIDRFIAQYASSDLFLDFEGSDIESLAFFYRGFGAVEEPYPQLKLNKLPALIKWIKR